MYRTLRIEVQAHQHVVGKPVPSGIGRVTKDVGGVKYPGLCPPGELWVDDGFLIAGTAPTPTVVRPGMWIVNHPQLGLLVYENSQFWGLIEHI